VSEVGEVSEVRGPAWPEHLQSLATDLNSEARGRFWLLLNLALAQRLHLHSRSVGWIPRERIQDLASEKALDLVGKLDCGTWNPSASSPGELVNFISTVARNALVDELRRERGRRAVSADRRDLHHPARGNPDAPALRVERKEFVSHLVACAEGLKPRHRSVWLLRVLYEMPSKSIAGHPEVLLKASHVDMILMRCRDRIRRCMQSKGHEVPVLPPGTFADLWKAFRLESSLGGGA